MMNLNFMNEIDPIKLQIIEDIIEIKYDIIKKKKIYFI